MGTNLPTDVDKPAPTSHVHRPSPKQSRRLQEESTQTRNAVARKLLQAWLADESGYEEETWPLLK